MRRHTLPCTLFIFLLSASAAWSMPFEKALNEADPQEKYFFYLHGAIVEQQGKSASSPRYGAYLYDDIIEHFDDRGLVVIDEVRGKTNPSQYASQITMQVRQLMAAGVPARNITVAGFSKGGYIALLVASGLGNPDVGYVIMAGCGKGDKAFAFEQFIKRKRGARLKGRIMSLYASSDLTAGSCRPAVQQSAGQGIAFGETRIMSSKGHGLFYQPRPEWVEPVAIFAKGHR